MERPAEGPLTGIRVVELGNLIAAPFAARLMAEFGAEVIKVEAPGEGDPLRKWRKLHEGTSLWWYLQSRNKKSVAVNMRLPEGQEVVRRLVRDADVLIENFRPGTLERWGLGWEALKAINPNLVMVRISGFGQDGPYRERPGFGAVGEAMGGMRFTTGEPDRPPARTGISIGDSLAALHAVMGALMALLAIKSGRSGGQVVDVSLYESVFNMMESLVPEYDLFDFVRARSGGSLPGIAPSNSYPTAEGSYVIVAGNGDGIFRRLMTAIGREDLATDPRLASNDGRVAHVEEIDGTIAAWTSRHSLDEVTAALDRAEVPNGRIYSVADIVADPQYLARDMILPSTLPDGTPVKMPGVVPKLSQTPGGLSWLGPKLGEHTAPVLAALGYGTEEIEALVASGAVAKGDAAPGDAA
ncbi:crotonobetainyl-CoA:carnitine CoA-transferase CaiB-like acyl-CoA transferase [Ancylobacter sp. 3268]|uniref:CaiB/BaiF CoA transferase family protein n=1 Tax=Ancylobacter sp. 3268 TaxID=2817752 RepID=UPI00285CA274|nr:CaiB/BaiF CoA-transferase family protein [Ancylobacter sp. 3268]MDR6952396.1 crotonobetainyl-CoA:carnitine CoA-transferase CaiB-like acyl-CoA transferase [Ancylobacter sp. 3268]